MEKTGLRDFGIVIGTASALLLLTWVAIKMMDKVEKK